MDPLVASTDVFMTSVVWVGSKSLSHVLACIDRTRARLIEAGAASEQARGQIISSVMDYWHAHPGVALSIIEKLLNYSILTPIAVINWALVGAGSDGGAALARPHVFEMVFHTVAKVTGRARLVVSDPAVDLHTKAADVAAMRALFAALEDALVGWATTTKKTKDEMDEGGDDNDDDNSDALLRRWGAKWLRVFRRRCAIEEAFLTDAAKAEAVNAEA
jgi:nuclear cap-binding protein subunit 1